MCSDQEREQERTQRSAVAVRVCAFGSLVFFFSDFVVFVIAVCRVDYYYYSTIGGKVHIEGTTVLSKIQYSL